MSLTLLPLYDSFSVYRDATPYRKDSTVSLRGANEEYEVSYSITALIYDDQARGVIYGAPARFTLFSATDSKVNISTGDRITFESLDYQVQEVSFGWNGYLAICTAILEHPHG